MAIGPLPPDVVDELSCLDMDDNGRYVVRSWAAKGYTRGWQDGHRAGSDWARFDGREPLIEHSAVSPYEIAHDALIGAQESGSSSGGIAHAVVDALKSRGYLR